MIFKAGGKPPGKSPPEKSEQTKEVEKSDESAKVERCSEVCGAAWAGWVQCAVVCACAMSLLCSGYGAVRQRALRERLLVLEEQTRALRSALLEPQQPLARLRRDLHYSDCMCPPGTCLLLNDSVLLTMKLLVLEEQTHALPSNLLELQRSYALIINSLSFIISLLVL
ncbi:unnamed protein product [Leptidea sinapis]|uniref:Uncharacterized protein n=1 Tax=Leptidea sinapis TaxID=189913 RepID=A0A5E4PZL7_9NEOP|nr:unnamed protein product [Leptidea sinapis]